MGYRVLFAADAERDFELIFDFLAESYAGFGEPLPLAMSRAEERIQAIREDALALAKAPHLGTRHDDTLPGLRHITRNRAVFWFDVSEKPKEVRILAVFFGGQDHIRRMLVRLLN